MKQLNPFLKHSSVLLGVFFSFLVLCGLAKAQEKTMAEHLKDSPSLVTLEVIPGAKKLKFSVVGKNIKTIQSFLVDDPRPLKNEIILQIKENGQTREVAIPLNNP